MATRVFGYLTQVTPASVNLNQLAIDFDSNTMSVGGNANSFESVKLYADIFKSATYTTPDSDSPQHAFKDVVLSSFAKSEKGATFALTMSYEPAIFDVNQNVTLVVPPQTTSSQANIFGTEGN